MAISEKPFQPNGFTLPATVPARIYENRSATWAFKDDLARIERTFDCNTVVKRAWRSQVVEQEPAAIELAFDKLAAHE